MRPDSDRGRLFLEQKLGQLHKVSPRTSRNAALDILTGGERSNASARSLGVTYWTARAFCANDDGAIGMDSVSNPPRVQVPAAAENPLLVRRERSDRPRVIGRFMRWLVVVVAAASVTAAAGLEFRVFTDRVDAAQVGPAQAHAAMEDVTSSSAAAPEALPNPPLELTSSSTLPTMPAPSVPVPSNVMGLLVDERFASNIRDWPNDPKGTTWLANGAYRLAARRSTQFVAVSIPAARDLGDAVVRAWFHKVDGPAGGGYGLILRDQHPDAQDGKNQLGHYYVFEAGDRGEIGVWLRDGDHWIDLLTWTPSDAVYRGTASNELTVSASGDQLSFVVNGTPVVTQTDTMLHTGAAGVFVGGDANEVALERLEVLIPL